MMGIDTTDTAEIVRSIPAIPMIMRKILFTSNQGKLLYLTNRHDSSFAAANRTITASQTINICSYFEVHSPAMA
jgi:hypothetical protein